MRRIKPLFLLGMVLSFLSVILLVASSWPIRRSIVQFDSADRGFLVLTGETNGQIRLDENGMIDLPTRYHIVLDTPSAIRKGGKEPLWLSVQPMVTLDPQSALAGWKASAEASLVFSQAIVHPEGSIFQRLAERKTADFAWLLSGENISDDSGTLWLYLLYTSPQEPVPVRILILARPIPVKVASFFGFRYPVIQIAAGLGLLAGSLLMISKVRPRLPSNH
jgi:hypothetical protein